MAGLIGMIKPLLPFMFAAILMGCAGNLMATFITILGGFGVRQVLGLYQGMTAFTYFYFDCGVCSAEGNPALCGAGKQPLYCV